MSGARVPSPAPSWWWGGPPWLRALTVLMYAAALYAVLERGHERRAIWRTQLVDKGIGGDGIQYWQMAVHLEREGIISFDGKEPTWLRLPGYPLLLRYTTRPAESDEGPTGPKDIQLRIDAWLQRAVRVNLAVDLATGAAAAFVGLALGGGPAALLAAGVWAWQPWSSVVAIHTLSDPLATLLTTLCLAAAVMAARAGPRRSRGPAAWLVVAGALAGMAQYVRADSILLVPAVALAGFFSTRPGPGERLSSSLPRRFGRALLPVLVWAAVFAPWPLRNRCLFGEAHLFGSAGLDAKGKPIDRSAAFEWMRTWCVGREMETVNVAWRLPSQSVRMSDIPHVAYDNADELSDLKYFLLEYNMAAWKLDEKLDGRLREMARRRRERDPGAFYVTLPLERMKLRLFPPRDGYGLGTLPMIVEQRERLEELDRQAVWAGLAGLALLLLRPSRRRLGLVAATWLLLRLALIGWIPAPEPRYLLEALPLIAAAATTHPDHLIAALAWLWRRLRDSPLIDRGAPPA